MACAPKGTAKKGKKNTLKAQMCYIYMTKLVDQVEIFLNH